LNIHQQLAEAEAHLAELKQANEAQRKSIEQLQELIETAPVIICRSDITARILYVNKEFEKVSGYSRQDVLGKRWTELGVFSAENVKLLLNRITEKLRGRAPSPLELKVRRKDGDWIWVSGIGEVVREQGKAVGFQVIATDITQKKQTEKQLLSSREMFAKAFKCSPQAIMVSKLEDGCFLDVNDSFLSITGYRYEEVIGHSSLELGLWVELKECDSTAQRMLRENRVRELEHKFRMKSGEIRTGLLSAEVVEIDGEPCALSTVQDITEQKNAEEALKERERHYRLLADNMADVIWTVDMNMQPTYISPSITRLLGYSVKEAMSKSMQEIFSPDSFNLAMTVLTEEMEIEKGQKKRLPRSRVLELELNHKDGYMVPVEVNYSLLCDSSERPVEILAVAREIQHRKQMEEEMKHGTEKILKAMENTIQAMVTVVEMRDPYTAGHQRRVTKLACAIADEIGLSKDQVSALRLASLVHDIGKVRVPAEILTNPDGLTEAEFSMIKTHPLIGYEILKKMELQWPIAEIVYQHHERMNGSGYPLGISGQEIILEARILAVADVVEAMSSHRPYRAARGIDKALEEISINKGILYDPDVVDVCLRLFSEKGFSFD